MLLKRRLKKHIFPLPTLSTERLTLRAMNEDDLYDLYDFVSLSKTTEHLPWSPHLNLFETKGFLEYVQKRSKIFNYHEWGIVLDGENKLIGTIGFTEFFFDGAEVGYLLSPKYQKQGYMTEAMRFLIDYSFSVLGLKRLRLRIMEKNASSRHLAEKLGFFLKEIKRDYMTIRGESRDVCFYYLHNKK